MTDALIDSGAAAAIAEGRHGDPFSVLGLHNRGGKWVVLGFDPGAEAMFVLTGKSGKAVAATPAIVSCWSTTGAADYVMKVLVPDIDGYERFLHGVAFKLPGVTHVRSSVVLKEVKAETRLPISASAAQPPAGPRAARKGRG